MLMSGFMIGWMPLTTAIVLTLIRLDRCQELAEFYADQVGVTAVLNPDALIAGIGLPARQKLDLASVVSVRLRKDGSRGLTAPTRFV